MANTRISNLTASASNLAATDVTPVVQTVGVGPVKMTGLQLAGGLLGSTTFNGSTVTTSSPVLNLTQTWNAGAVTFTGLRFNAAGSSNANSAAGSLLLDLQVGGVSQFNVGKGGGVVAGQYYGAGGDVKVGESNSTVGVLFAVSGAYAGAYIGDLYGLRLRSDYALTWTSSGINAKNTADLFLTRDAANTLALKNSTNPQIFRAYSTTTGPSYGYLAAGVTDAGVATADTLFIGTGGAGAAMTKLALAVNGTTRLDYGVSVGSSWYFTGAVATSGNINGGGYVNAALASGFAWGSVGTRSAITSSADGVIMVSNAAGSDFSRLQFGGTTSSFPALKRSTTTLQVRLADDSAYAPVEASTVRTATAYTVATLPAAGTAGRRAYVTDATAPTYLGALIGGGAVVCPVFDNGTAWVSA